MSVPLAWIEDLESALAFLEERERSTASKIMLDATIDRARRAGWKPQARRGVVKPERLGARRAPVAAEVT